MPRNANSPGAARRWTFTLNNYTTFDELTVKNYLQENAAYAVFGYERANTGTPHLQGFFTLCQLKRLNQIKRDLGIDEIHLEKACGNIETNRTYCTKSGNFWEHGTRPSYNNGGGGGNADSSHPTVKFIAVMNNPHGSTKLNEYMQDYPKTWLMHGSRMLNNYYLAQSEIKRDNILAIWIHGITGIGKSRFAHAILPNAYRKAPNLKWWHSYRLQTSVIVDDLNLDAIDVSYWLLWLDRYPCCVETKGGEMPLHASLFILTSNYHPSEIFRTNTDALLRRLKVFSVNSNDDFTPIQKLIDAHKLANMATRGDDATDTDDNHVDGNLDHVTNNSYGDDTDDTYSSF